MNDEISLQIDNNFSGYIKPSQIRGAIYEVLRYTGIEEKSALTAVFDGDDLLQAMNQKFRGIDAPTDVLSFPVDYIDPETNESYLGDILISVPRAVDQAAAGEHSVEEELQLLVVHGVLHLLGYDHNNDEDKERMQAAQSVILQRLGINLEITL